MKSSTYFIGFLKIGFMITLFLPWMLSPNSEIYTLDSISGFAFLSANIPVLIFVLFMLIFYLILLRFKNMRIWLLLEMTTLFLTGLFLYPVFYLGIGFFIGTLYGYFIGMLLLLILNVYNTIIILKYLKKEDHIITMQ